MGGPVDLAAFDHHKKLRLRSKPLFRFDTEQFDGLSCHLIEHRLRSEGRHPIFGKQSQRRAGLQRSQLLTVEYDLIACSAGLFDQVASVFAVARRFGQQELASAAEQDADTIVEHLSGDLDLHVAILDMSGKTGGGGVGNRRGGHQTGAIALALCLFKNCDPGRPVGGLAKATVICFDAGGQRRCRRGRIRYWPICRVRS